MFLEICAIVVYDMTTLQSLWEPRQHDKIIKRSRYQQCRYNDLVPLKASCFGRWSKPLTLSGSYFHFGYLNMLLIISLTLCLFMFRQKNPTWIHTMKPERWHHNPPFPVSMATSCKNPTSSFTSSRRPRMFLEKTCLTFKRKNALESIGFEWI